MFWLKVKSLLVTLFSCGKYCLKKYVQPLIKGLNISFANLIYSPPCSPGGAGSCLRAIHALVGALVYPRPWHNTQRHGRGGKPLCVGCQNAGRWTCPDCGPADPSWGTIHLTGWNDCFFLHLLLSSLLACLWLVIHLVLSPFALKLLYIFNLLSQRAVFSQPATTHEIHILTPAYVHTLLLFMDLSLPVISTFQSSPPGHVPSVQRNQLWETGAVYSSS